MLTADGHAYVLVHERVTETMSRWLHPKGVFREAGGILIGAYRGPHIEILDCTVPMGRDIRKHSLFDRRDPGHQRAAMLAWKRSGGTETFVGEWHTHPELDPHYSSVDRKTWDGLMGRSSEPLIFAIAGWRTSWWARGDAGNLTALNANLT